MYQYNSYSSSHNLGVYYSGDQSGDDGSGGYSYQEAIHSSSCNFVTRVDVDGRGGYKVS